MIYKSSCFLYLVVNILFGNRHAISQHAVFTNQDSGIVISSDVYKSEMISNSENNTSKNVS